ncbi:MAG TPA: DUF4340 domain-containing protein [Kofleriaceae bacterium]|nr:DUF4340 domain-containing protein [Kofleriaceae bacterium]
MLTRFHKILIGLLAVQIVLAVIVLTRGDDATARKEHPLFAGFDAAKVTRVQVFGDKAAGAPGAPGDKPADKPIDLVKRGNDWVLASGFDYPADAAKIGDALAPIAKLAAGAPIATQASRHKQLKVADDEYARKLVMTADGKDLTLFIGGSAGTRRTAVRLAGSDDVYAVAGVAASSLGVEPRQWVDPDYVKVAAADLAKVTIQRGGTSIELTKVSEPAAGSGDGSAAPPAEHWTATIGGAPITLGKDETLDEAAITRLVDAASSIELSAPADAKRDASHPTATITLDRKPGSKPGTPTVVDLIVDGDKVWAHDRSAQRAVLADKLRLDPVLGADRDKLVKKPAPPAPAKAGSAAAASGLPPGVELPPGMELPPGVAPPGAP